MMKTQETPQISGAFCPVFHRAIELIGRRWTGAIVRALMAGATRFGELTEIIPETPVKIEYHLTDKGRALGPVLDAIGTWAGDWVGPHGTPPEHR